MPRVRTRGSRVTRRTKNASVVALQAFSENLVSTDDAAKLLNLSANTLRWWRSVGLGPDFYKLGRNVKYDVDTLFAWVKANVRCPSVSARAREDANRALQT